jgi:hypothetical protein
VQVEPVKYNNMEKKEFIKDLHYYLEEGRVVFTALQHLERGYCCGNNCRHCPYEPKAIKGNKIVAEDKKR